VEESEINITYETLYELFRREKNREELQELNKTFFKDLVEYINIKKQMMNPTDGENNFTDAQKQKAMVQFENIKKILKELYEKRERKIVSIALNKSRTGSDIINTKILLDEEKLFYDDLLNLLNNYRSGIQNKLIDGLMPNLSGNGSKSDDVSVSNATGEVIDSTNNVSQTNDTTSNTTENVSTTNNTQENSSSLPAEDKPVNATKQVKFIQGVPKFVGKELETYGPYESDDTATLPLEIASILIKKGRAIEISTS
jgi:DNA replication initiation complex subunit (GINS family)